MSEEQRDKADMLLGKLMCLCANSIFQWGVRMTKDGKAELHVVLRYPENNNWPMPSEIEGIPIIVDGVLKQE